MEHALAGAYGGVVFIRGRNRFLLSVLLHATGFLLLPRVTVWTPQWHPVPLARAVCWKSFSGPMASWV